jgi:hypothetical protein
VGEADVVGVGVGEDDGLDLLDLAAEAARAWPSCGQ